jgi:predicted RNA binding protein YcfA (HicA-like mRNA interferase family)
VGQQDLPLASGPEHVKAFERAGWVCAKKRAKQAHFVLKKAGHPHAISIPSHKEVKRALLQKQIKLAGLSEEEYLEFFQGKRGE